MLRHSLKPLPTDIVLRAWAICWVVFNHAHVYGPPSTIYTGGMTVLIMLSGFSFARSALVTGDIVLVRSHLLRLCYILFWPSVVVILMSFVQMQSVRLVELAMISNWISVENVARMQLWYVQVMIQMALALVVVFSFPPVMSAFRSYPAIMSVLALGGAVTLNYYFKQTCDTSYLFHRLPHLLLWNFVLGWSIYFLGFGERANMGSKLLAFALCVGAGMAGWSLSEPGAYWLAGCTALLLTTDKVRLPSPVAWAVSISSQALLAIFILHTIFLGLFRALFDIEVPAIAFLFALCGCIATWSFLIALVRTHRHLKDPWHAKQYNAQAAA